jgi:hypothetical protein
MKQTLLAAVMRNTVSLIGVILAALSATLIVLLSIVAAAGLAGPGPYFGIVSYVVLPAVFVLGLVLIPAGLYWQRRRARRAARHAGTPVPALPVLDLNHPGTRASLAGALLIALVSIVILGGAGYKGVEVLDSTRFCAQACHTVMQPEAVAHERSPHARVACVECHVGPGASWFVKAKINGLAEMVQLATNDFPRPIPTPIDNLRPARVVCEQCHWPARFLGDQLVIDTHYASDEANTRTKTVLMVHIGGQSGLSLGGIHWHVGPGVTVRYQSDPSRQQIYTVELTLADGSRKAFKDSTAPPANVEWRTMDCVDCHNRPTHTFHPPAEEIDAALDDGRIDTSLPFIKREGLQVLQDAYASQAQARREIGTAIEQFYRSQYPAVASGRASAVTAAAQALGDIWSWNVFPQMKVTWNTYPDNLGHQQSPGCFRCHDNHHVTGDGERIPRKCDLCHNVLAEDDPAPAVLKELE